MERNTLRRIETEMTKKHKKDGKPPPGQARYIRLSTMVKLLETVLIVLREYPPWTLCAGSGKIRRRLRRGSAQQSVKKRYEEIDALFNKYDAQVNATRLAKPREGVQVLPFKEIVAGKLRERFLAILRKYWNSTCTSTCISEFVSRRHENQALHRTTTP